MNNILPGPDNTGFTLREVIGGTIVLIGLFSMPLGLPLIPIGVWIFYKKSTEENSKYVDKNNQFTNEDFHEAIYRARPLTALSMLKRSNAIDINSQGMFGGTALHWLCSQAGSVPSEEDRLNGVTSFVPIMIELGADPNSTCDIGTTPLHWAVMWNNYEAVEELLKYDVDVNAKDTDGITPLHLCMIGYAFEFRVIPSFTTHAGFYVELLKCQKNVIPHLDDIPSRSAELLLEHGAEINPIDALDRTPLDWANKLTKWPSMHYTRAINDLTSCLEANGAKTFEDLQYSGLRPSQS